MTSNPFAIAGRYERRAIELATVTPVRLREIRQLRQLAEAEIVLARASSLGARLIPLRGILFKLNTLIYFIRRREIRRMKERKLRRMIDRLEKKLDDLERDLDLD
jgi:hypothetical protein